MNGYADIQTPTSTHIIHLSPHPSTRVEIKMLVFLLERKCTFFSKMCWDNTVWKKRKFFRNFRDLFSCRNATPKILGDAAPHSWWTYILYVYSALLLAIFGPYSHSGIRTAKIVLKNSTPPGIIHRYFTWSDCMRTNTAQNIKFGTC